MSEENKKSENQEEQPVKTTDDVKIEGGAAKVDNQTNNTASGAKAEGEDKSTIAKAASSEAEHPPGPAPEAPKDAKTTPSDAGKDSGDAQQPPKREADAPKAKETSADKASGEKTAGPKARQAAAGAKASPKASAKKAEDEQDEEPKPPSPNQPRLDRIVSLIKEQLGEEALEEAYLNDKDRDRPTLVIVPEHWPKAMELLKKNPELNLNYLRNVSGVDYETHMEVDYFLLSLTTEEDYLIKIRTDRENPSVPSATPVWETANWQEREIYDLLGIDFPGHPDLRRIMMSDDWVGHPLRKDYEPFDPEV